MNKRKVYPGYFVLGALIIYLVFMVIPGLIGIGFFLYRLVRLHG